MPPSNLKFTLLDLVLLILFYFCTFLLIKEKANLLKRSKKQIRIQVLNQIVLIIVFSLGLVFGLLASSPKSQTYEEMTNQKEKLLAAAESGYNLCQQVREDKISERSVTDFIKQIYPSDPESQETAYRVYNEFRKDPDNAEAKSALERLLPTVPVLYQVWTCNIYGCSFGEDQFIWTISATNRNLGIVLNAVSLLMITITTNKTFKIFRKPRA